MGFDPSWGLKYPQGTPGLIPPVYVFSRQLTKIQILFVNFVHFCSFPYIIIFFGSFLAIFEPHTVPHTGPRVPIWTLTPKSITWLLIQPKNGPWLLNLLWFFNFFTFMAIFSHFFTSEGPLEGPLRATSNSWGPPRPPISSLTSRDTLPPGLVPTKRALFLDSVMVFQFFYFHGHF